jgi:acyl carrier protein
MWDEKFENLLRRQLPFLSPGEALTEQARLADLGLDSMGTVELMAALEREYGVRFADEALDLDNFATPGVLWGTVSQLTQPA